MEEFNDYFNALKERCPSATTYLKHEVVFEKWSRAHFSGNRFNVMTSNIAESLNSMLCNEREYPLVAIFNSIAHIFGKIFKKRFAEVDNSMITFIPVAEMILSENMTEGYKFYMKNINGITDEFTVLGYGHSTKVNLSRQSCSCRKYDLVKLPYAHAMAELRLKHGERYAPLESEWNVAREYLEMQVLTPDFDPKLRQRKKPWSILNIISEAKYLREKKMSRRTHPLRPLHRMSTINNIELLRLQSDLDFLFECFATNQQRLDRELHRMAHFFGP
ncbi:hypothetical protein CQW23_15465 [Capsicum baccatum]|uniref:Zinc finger PMZ-type domain-containing protein n=1 Tax=Capsicum baccatum TaxID=33114 RepID=A0A2G2WM40_CAPBA|nr:hypothetical protein CQW23_15465 [Capsicum baccatum]